jgi:hypothetical protein
VSCSLTLIQCLVKLYVYILLQVYHVLIVFVANSPHNLSRSHYFVVLIDTNTVLSQAVCIYSVAGVSCIDCVCGPWFLFMLHRQGRSANLCHVH